MKKYLLTVLFLIFAVTSFGQDVTTAQTAQPIFKYLGKLAADPTKCETSTPTQYFNTVTKKFRYCAAQNKFKNISDDDATTKLEAFNNSLPAALAALGATPAVLEIGDGSLIAPLTANQTVPKNIKLKIADKGYFTINAGQTVTIKDGAGFSAPSGQYVFRGSGNVVFDQTYPPDIYPEWFGAVGDDDGTTGTDNYAAFTRTVNSMRAVNTIGWTRGGAVRLTGKYYSSESIFINRAMEIYARAGYAGAQQHGFRFAPCKAGLQLTSNTSDNNNPPYPRNSANSRLSGFYVIGAPCTAAHNVNLTTVGGLLTVTKLSGTTFIPENGFTNGNTVTIGAHTFIIRTIESPTQLTLYPYRLTGDTNGLNATITPQFVGTQNGADTNWIGGKLFVNGTTYTINNVAGNTLTLNGIPPASQAATMEVTEMPVRNNVAMRLNDKNGIVLHTKATLDALHVYGFGGHGIECDTTSQLTYQINCNLSAITNTTVYSNYGSGLFMRGNDANQLVVTGLDAQLNYAAGIWDSSFLGNFYASPHGSQNLQGNYLFGKSGNFFPDGREQQAGLQNTVVAGYSESGSPPEQCVSSVESQWNTHASGFDYRYKCAFREAEYGGLKTTSAFRYKRDATEIGNAAPSGFTTQIGAFTTVLPTLFGFGIDNDNYAQFNGNGISYSLTHDNQPATGWLALKYGSPTLNNTLMAFSTSASVGGAGNLWFPKGFKLGTNGTYKTSEIIGRCTLVAGVCTVSNSNITANTNVMVQRQTDGGTVGASYSVTRSAGVSFTVTSKDGAGATNTADTSTLAYSLIEF